MEEKDDLNHNVNKLKKILKKAKSEAAVGFKFIGDGAKNILKNVETKIRENNAEKELNQTLENLFYKQSIELIAVVSNKLDKGKKIKGVIDYDKKTITFYGDLKWITADYIFIDEHKQTFSIKQIRSNQYVKLNLNSIEYTRPITIVEYLLKSDEKTQSEMKTIVNNVAVNNSNIFKSNLGN